MEFGSARGAGRSLCANEVHDRARMAASRVEMSNVRRPMSKVKCTCPDDHLTQSGRLVRWSVSLTLDMGRLTLDILADALVLFRCRTAEVFVGPRNKVLPVRLICVVVVMLLPRKLFIDETDIHGRYLFGLVIIGPSEIFGAEQP